MLKWLSNARPNLKSQNDLVTDDPLATITHSPKDNSDIIYSVSRVNPIFEEDGFSKDTTNTNNHLKQSSSGYESRHSTDHIDSNFGKEKDCQRESITILEQNTSFVKSILIAVRGKKPNQNAVLNPIPEGKIDYTIPRPVWPRNESKYRKQNVDKNEERHRDGWYSENEKSNRTIGNNNFIIRPKKGFEEKNDSTKDILKDIAKTINLAIEQKNQISPEDLLKTLSDTINKNWEMLSSESALRQLSQNLNQTEAVATISRAFSHTSSFSEPFISHRPLSDAEAGRLLLLQRLGKLSLYDPIFEKHKHSRGSSTSSEETSSGFSEISPTPTTSSESPTSRRSPDNTKVPIFTHDNLSTVSNGLRNAVLYGTGFQCRDNQNDYERLNFRGSKSSSDQSSNEEIAKEISSSSWEDATFNAINKYDSPYNSQNLNIPGINCPDFTLDTHQAEKLMSKIEATKRQRCWCRVVTSLLGLFFLLFSVMTVSMYLTRGQRMFGSL